MPDMIDKIISPAPAGAPQGGEPAVSQGAAEQSLEEKLASAERRRKAHYQDLQQARTQLESQAGELQEMKERMARLEGPSSGGNGSAAPGSWSDFSDTDLLDTYARSAGNPDEGQAPNPHAQAQAIREMIRRESAAAREDSAKSAESLISDHQHRASVMAQIQQRYGDDAANQDSELYQTANAYAASLQNRYGKDILTREPEMAMLAFSLAHGDLRSGDRERIKTMETELSRIKAAQSMEPGALGAARLGDDAREALDKGDIKGATNAVVGRLFGGH